MTEPRTTPYLARLRAAEMSMFDAWCQAWRPDLRAEWRRCIVLYTAFVVGMMDRELMTLHTERCQTQHVQQQRRQSRRAEYALRFRAE